MMLLKESLDIIYKQSISSQLRQVLLNVIVFSLKLMIGFHFHTALVFGVLFFF